MPAPTRITSAKERSAASTATSAGLDSPPETSSRTVEPSMLATMHTATYGRPTGRRRSAR
ncbi:MAG: hypothetical protein V9E89_16090 [Ilumatobacteraceae bacterium]